MRILGIDYGKKRIGFAVGDTERRIAFPRGVVKSEESAMRYVMEEKAGGVEKIVVGIPMRHSGEEGELVEEVRIFAKKIKEESNLPVEFENELLSTKAIKKGTVKRELIDAAAAAIILQTYLDRMATSS